MICMFSTGLSHMLGHLCEKQLVFIVPFSEFCVNYAPVRTTTSKISIPSIWGCVWYIRGVLGIAAVNLHGMLHHPPLIMAE